MSHLSQRPPGLKLTCCRTHIRPLWRLQSHSHQPDLFTSNPSLLHHFQTPGANAIVTQGASAASGASSGAAGGAGRAGYSGASSGGGYTGHARAFLSLQGPGADASTGVNAANDENEVATRQRAHLALKQRISTPARDDPTTKTVVLRQRLAARAGSRQVRTIELEPASEEAPTKRASIAYPSWASLPADAAPGGALWGPGAAPKSLGARAFHTRATRLALEPELVSATPPADSVRIKQPNRVLMDLAGLDLSRPNNRQQVRRNSTASIVRPDAEDIAAAAAANTADERDKALYHAIRNAPAADVQALIEHYRTPRSVSEPAEGNAGLAAQYPLPSGYTVQTYNVCLQSLLRFRERGQSIAPILDIYNEMLARDVVPNIRTTELVVNALCLREEDVAAASDRWNRDRAAQTFKAEQLGLPIEENGAEDSAAEAAILAYQSENNLGSALKLYSVAQTFYPRVDKSFILRDLVTAAAAAAELPNGIPIEQLAPVLQTLIKYGTTAQTFEKIFEIYAAVGDKEGFQKAWQKFLTLAPEAGTRQAVAAGIAGFIKLGDVEAALKVAEDAQKLDSSIVLHASNAMVAGLTAKGDLDGALEWLAKSGAFRAAAYDLADALAKQGRYSDVDKVSYKINELHLNQHETMANGRSAQLTAQLLAQALKASDADKKKEALMCAFTVLKNGVPMDSQIARLFADQLIENGLAAHVPNMLLRFAAREPQADPDVRAIVTAMVSADVPLNVLLDTLRATGRLGVVVAASEDTANVAQTVVDRYMAARAAVQSYAELQLTGHHAFRLLESIVNLPEEFVESGKADPVFEQFLADLAEFSSQGLHLQGGLTSSVAAADLADLITARFGPEKAANLLMAAFGDSALGMLPQPEATTSPTDSSFTMPPTPADSVPPGEFQPPSPHTLHIAPGLNHLIDRLQFHGATETPSAIYETVRGAISNENAVPSPDSLGRLMIALARENDEGKVRELYSLSQIVLTSCLPDALAQADGWRKVEDAMISACCFLGHLEQAGMHRARIIDAGMTPSADAYATMIASSRDSTDDALVARELFDESQALGVIPHLYLYNTIISKLSKARKAETALELFAHMKAAGVRPSSVTYGAVINACCRVGDEKSAEMLFEEMSSQKNFRARVPPYNTMMQFYLQTRPDRSKVLKYYDAMRAAGVHPSAHTYKLLLDTFGTLQPLDLQSMNRVFDELSRNRFVPMQGTHWASLITAYGLHAGDLEKAKDVFKRITSHPSFKRNSIIEPVVWEAILNVVGQRGTLEDLEHYRNRLERSPYPSTAYVCNVLISGYSRHGEIAKAREVFEAMGDSITGVAAPNNHPTLLTSSGHKKPSTVTQAPIGVVFREPSTYEAMIRAELAAGNREAAEAVLARMEERRYPVAVWMKARAILDDAAVQQIHTQPTPAQQPATQA